MIRESPLTTRTMLIRRWTTSLITLLAFVAAAHSELRAQSAARPALRGEVDSLHAAMTAAFRRDPASVASFYTDDARIIGMGVTTPDAPTSIAIGAEGCQ